MLVVSRIKHMIGSVLWNVAPGYMIQWKYNNPKSRFHGGYDNRSMAEDIEESFRYFLSDDRLGDKAYMKEIISDIVLCNHRYGTNAIEYFNYRFPDKNATERATYLPRKQKDMLLKRMTPEAHRHFDELKDKNLFYEIAKPYFKRVAIKVESKADKDAFCQLLSAVGRVIAKPTRGGCGSGVEILDLKDFNNEDNAFEHLRLNQTSYIVEEVVEQDPRIAVFNPSSLNTIRIPIFRTKEGIKIFYPSVRFGRAGSVVDNAGAGGTFAAVDADTGVVSTEGFDKHGNTLKEHPDSHMQYKGFQIPEWESLKDFVVELHNAMPSYHKYIAYDLALSSKGWVVVEANWGEISMPQIEFGIGLKKEFIELLLG